MNKIFTKAVIIVIIYMFCNLNIAAQSTEVKKASESVFTITAFKTDGSISNTSHGFFISADGVGVCPFETLKNASSAVIIDNKGQKRNVERIMGYNNIYDVVKIKVDGNSKSIACPLVKQKTDDALWIVEYSNKSAKVEKTKVKSVETFNEKYSYYILTQVNNAEQIEGCPIVNDKGQAVGIAQKSKYSTDIHATDAKFAADITTSAMDYSDNTLKQINIPLTMPEDLNQAKLALMFAESCGDIKYDVAIADFTKAHPTLLDGYLAAARKNVRQNDFATAKDIMNKAINSVAEKDDAHYNYAKLIYQKEIDFPDKPFAEWGLATAKKEIDVAYSIKQLPLYKFLEGNILYEMKDYNAAYNIFMSLIDSNMKGGDLYFEAAKCKSQSGAPDEEVLALLDSAVNNVDTLNYRSALPYFMMRANVYEKMKNYRQAVFDYTRYEVLSNGNVGPEFYYVREQAEIKTKLFKQALTDIQRAIILAPNEPLYYAELGSLQLRLNMFDDAVITANRCIEIAPEVADAYLILGLAQIKLNKKKEGLESLNKAVSLGNEQAKKMIAKYK